MLKDVEVLYFNLKLDADKLKELKYRNKEYSIIFDSVLKRYNYLFK